MTRMCTDQEAYDLGYSNPSTPVREFEFGHLVLANAFVSGQSDAQNKAPRNAAYDRNDYDPITGEQNLPNVEFKSR